MPPFDKLKKGEIQSKHQSPLLALKWHDKREIYLLTTLHNDSVGPSGKTNRSTGEPILKPQCVLDYKKNMGLVQIWANFLRWGTDKKKLSRRAEKKIEEKNVL